MAQPLTKKTVIIPREQNKFGFDTIRITADYRLSDLVYIDTAEYETVAKSTKGYQYEPEIWRKTQPINVPQVRTVVSKGDVDPCVEVDGRIVTYGDDGMFWPMSQVDSSVD
jgi:hypothetical protein